MLLWFVFRVAWFQTQEICRSGPIFAIGLPEVRRGVQPSRGGLGLDCQSREIDGPALALTNNSSLIVETKSLIVRDLVT